MAVESQQYGQEQDDEDLQPRTTFGGLTPEAQAQLLQQEYGDEPYYTYLARITKSEFGLSVISQILPWYESKKLVRHSPFTIRTQRILIIYLKDVLDKLELLQNLSDKSDKRIAELWIHKLTNELMIAVNRIDTEKPEFHTIINNIIKHAWTIRTLAVGLDRERILEARRDHRIYQELRSGVIPSSQSPKKSLFDIALGR
jgi:hypothetical protein